MTTNKSALLYILQFSLFNLPYITNKLPPPHTRIIAADIVIRISLKKMSKEGNGVFFLYTWSYVCLFDVCASVGAIAGNTVGIVFKRLCLMKGVGC
jgi:hypothetical protein